MGHGSIRGSRLGGWRGVDVDRGAALAGRKLVEFHCGEDHRTAVVFSDVADVPPTWECHKCGEVAVTEIADIDGAARPSNGGFHRTPYEFMMMRRTEEDGEALLSEALDELRKQRRSAR